MSLKQYNWTNGEVITADKLNRGGVTIVGSTYEENAGKMHATLDMTLQEIYDAMGKGIVVSMQGQPGKNSRLAICASCTLAIPEEDDYGFAVFRSMSSGNEFYEFGCATNDGFPQYDAE